jgi:T-complex protein 1 subunit eta
MPGGPGMMRPPIIVLREGTDASQGRSQILSNITACQSIVQVLATTLGPRGMDKLIVDGAGKATISNDGATIAKLLDIVHPAARTLVDIARAQDAEVGDGTTSVVLLAGELLKAAKSFIEEGVAPQILIKGFRTAGEIALTRIRQIAVDIAGKEGVELRQLLERCASTSMNSKLVKAQQAFFSNMVVDAVMILDPVELDEKMIGIKKVTGGALQDSQLVDGVAFEKTFSYAGFEQQPKHFDNPKICLLNVELELKAERDNAEVRIEKVSEYQRIVDAEWSILFDRLENIVKSGAQIVLSKLAIGDVATQYFADRGIFAAGRVPESDLQRMLSAVGGAILTTVTEVPTAALGSCAKFEELQVGEKRYNFFTGCPKARTCTLLLRGGAEQFIAEVERSLHDAIMVVRRALTNRSIVAGGGAVEMELARFLREQGKAIAGKQQLVILAAAQAFEIIPRQLCENAGFDATDLLTQLRKRHAQGDLWAGIDIQNERVTDNMEAFVWEPSLVKSNAIAAAIEAACTILSVDLTVKAAKHSDQGIQSALPGVGANGMPMGGAGSHAGHKH